MCLKFKEEIINPSTPINLINDDYGITVELFLFASNIKKKVSSVLDSFLFFKKNLKREKLTTCCLWFKNLCLVSYFVGQEEHLNIVDEYDKKTLYLMFLKCYRHLHLMTKSIECVNQTGNEDSSLGVKS
jgi:hypothetical protein